MRCSLQSRAHRAQRTKPNQTLLSPTLHISTCSANLIDSTRSSCWDCFSRTAGGILRVSQNLRTTRQTRQHDPMNFQTFPTFCNWLQDAALALHLEVQLLGNFLLQQISLELTVQKMLIRVGPSTTEVLLLHVIIEIYWDSSYSHCPSPNLPRSEKILHCQETSQQPELFGSIFLQVSFAEDGVSDSVMHRCHPMSTFSWCLLTLLTGNGGQAGPAYSGAESLKLWLNWRMTWPLCECATIVKSSLEYTHAAKVPAILCVNWAWDENSTRPKISTRIAKVRSTMFCGCTSTFRMGIFRFQNFSSMLAFGEIKKGQWKCEVASAKGHWWSLISQVCSAKGATWSIEVEPGHGCWSELG